MSDYNIKKIIHYFCLDIDATKTAELANFNRNTINSYFVTFRCAIELNQLVTFQKLGGALLSWMKVTLEPEEKGVFMAN